MSCLQIKVTNITHRLIASTSLFCSVIDANIALLVEDGFLFVDDNGEIAYLCVNKS